jgi:hypothetical protein
VFAHLPRALEVDLEDHVPAGGHGRVHRRGRGAVAVLAVHHRPLQQAVGLDQLVEAGVVDEEVVHPVHFARARRPGGR